MKGKYRITNPLNNQSQIANLEQRGFFYPSGQLKEQGDFTIDMQNGQWTYWHENGTKKAEGLIKNNMQDGHWIYWHDNGKKEREGDWSYLDMHKRKKMEPLEYCRKSHKGRMVR